MSKNTFRLLRGLAVVSAAVALCCACAPSRQSSAPLRTPDYCGLSENRKIPKKPAKASRQPAPDTPIGGNFTEKRR
ncbi:MAG: hypothetical protein K2O66_00070 [Bacteroidales bacterium]|nr:hypothetical protein [Bacteroidales bacterium]MDE7071743.1 hypothetical protein [Bacteroidales bacterium]